MRLRTRLPLSRGRGIGDQPGPWGEARGQGRAEGPAGTGRGLQEPPVTRDQRGEPGPVRRRPSPRGAAGHEGGTPSGRACPARRPACRAVRVSRPGRQAPAGRPGPGGAEILAGVTPPPPPLVPGSALGVSPGTWPRPRRLHAVPTALIRGRRPRWPGAGRAAGGTARGCSPGTAPAPQRWRVLLPPGRRQPSLTPDPVPSREPGAL